VQKRGRVETLGGGRENEVTPKEVARRGERIIGKLDEQSVKLGWRGGAKNGGGSKKGGY